MRSNIFGCHNIQDLQRRASRVLPSPIRQYLEGGADDESTLERNMRAFDEWTLIPRTLVDVCSVDLTTSIFGMRSSMPLILSPTGMSRLFDPMGEMAVARAASAAGLPYGLSTMATTSIEDVATCGGGRYFQLYLFRDRGLTEALLERAWTHGFTALCLTTDTPVGGNRERDLRTGMMVPPRFALASLASFASHPRWAARALTGRAFQLVNVAEHSGALASSGINVIDYINKQFDRSASWKDVEWLRSKWPGKLVIKGAMAPADCLSAVGVGADGIMISNHGGRQLDGTAAPLDYLPLIRERVGDRIELVVDGGVRRGTHVLKALALGADACSIGRPYLYGLAAAGEAGVRRAISIYRSELERDMALLGKTRIGEVSFDDVHHLSEFATRPGVRPSRAQRIELAI